MILSVYGTYVEVLAGSCLEDPAYETYGCTKIESIEVIDDNGFLTKPKPTIKSPRLEEFKKEKNDDENFLSSSKLKVNTKSFVWRWRIEDDKWDPKKMVHETWKIILPDGQIDVLDLNYSGRCDTSRNEEIVKSVVWTCEDGKWKKSKE